MNLEFMLAICFGVGVAGAIYNFDTRSSWTLVSRVDPKAFMPRPSSNQSLKISSRLTIRNVSTRAKTQNRILQELAETIDVLVVSLRAGDGLFRSLAFLVPRCQGLLAKELSKVLVAVNYGAALGTELARVSQEFTHPQVKEFVSKVIDSLERGTPLADMLQAQSASIRAEISNQLLRQAGKNETRMLLPLVFLILPVTVLFAIYPSLELLNFGFF